MKYETHPKKATIFRGNPSKLAYICNLYQTSSQHPKQPTKTTPPNRNNDPSNQNTAPPRRPTEMLRKVESLQYVSRWDEQKPEPGGCNLKPQENNIRLTTSHPFLYIPTDIMAQLCYSYSCYFIGFLGGDLVVAN